MPLSLSKIKVTQELVKHLYDYNPETGELTWKNSTSPKVNVGDNAYSLSHNYYSVFILGKNYLAHRIIWLYVHGYLPENDIDHIDRNGLNNKLSNLREVSRSCNMRNVGVRKNSKTGVTGVSFVGGHARWYANITVNGKTYSLGCHYDFFEAVCTRLATEQCLNWYRCDSDSPAYQRLRASLNK